MATDNLAQLGDALDAEEQQFRARWPHRPLWHAVFAGRSIEPAYDAYHRAVRAEVAERPSSEWCRCIAATEFPDKLSLRQVIEDEAARMLSSRAIKARLDWEAEIPARRWQRFKNSRPVTDGYVNTGRTAIVDGERVPIIRKAQP